MRSVLCTTACALAFGALFPATALANPQHERMKRCNAEARAQALKGEERRSFMSNCLKGRHDGSAKAGPDTSGAAAGAPAQDARSPAAAAGGPESVAASTLKERRRQCNREATEQSLRGAERKAFVSGCMAG